MKKVDNFLDQFFKHQQVMEQLKTPSFNKVFKNAQKEKRKKKRRKFSWMVASIAVLAIIGFAINEDNPIINENQIIIAKGSTNLYARLMAEGEIVTNDIHFEYNKAVLKPGSFTIIKEVAAMMKKHPEVRLKIEGHTDNSGSAKYNQALSEKRAAAVMASLLKLGIKTSRLTSEGFGESKPLNSNKTEKERILNRRVVFAQIK